MRKVRHPWGTGDRIIPGALMLPASRTVRRVLKFAFGPMR